MIVETAFQEDADVIGLSILSGAHLEVFPEILRLMREKEMSDVLVIAGGIIPRGGQTAPLGTGAERHLRSQAPPPRTSSSTSGVQRGNGTTLDTQPKPENKQEGGAAIAPKVDGPLERKMQKSP